jgi:hypothetical protein
MNVQGEIQQKLDVFANETIIKALDHGGACARWRRKRARHHSIPEQFKCGKYCPAVRPARRLLQHRRERPGRYHLLGHAQDHAGGRGELEDMLQPGSDRWPPATSSTARARCWCTRPGRGCTASRSILRSASSCSRTPTSDSGSGPFLSVNESYERLGRAVKALMRRYRGPMAAGADERALRRLTGG